MLGESVATSYEVRTLCPRKRSENKKMPNIRQACAIQRIWNIIGPSSGEP